MKLLAIRLSAFGDVIHTIPAVVALRDAGHDVVWVVERPYREIVSVVAGVDTIAISMKRWGGKPGEMFAARAAMRGFDVAIDFQGLIKSASLAWVSRARLRYGFDRAAIREGAAGVFLNRRVEVDRTQHVVEWNLALARAVEPTIDGVPEVDFTPYAQDPGGDFRGRIILLPGAGRREKQWPYFAELAKQLDHPLVVWGPGERELAESVGAEVAPPTSLRELAYLLLHALVVIGGDTGPLHLAAALGTPVVGLYGPTNPSRNGPYGQLGNVVKGDTMESLKTDAVLSKINDASLTSESRFK